MVVEIPIIAANVKNSQCVIATSADPSGGTRNENANNII